MIAEELKIVIEAEVAKAVSELKKLKGSQDQAEKSTTGLTLSQIKSAAAAAGLGIALAKLVQLGKESVRAYKTQIDADTKLQATLKATGNAAGFTFGELKAYAGELQGLTTVGDEVVESGLAVLATFKSIQDDAFKRTAEAALDVSAVMGQDLQSSMVQLGKAVENPKEGLGALARVGVTFTEQEKEQITALQESNKLREAQAILLGAVEGQFKGAAQALAQTDVGKLEQLNNAIGDMKEQFGRSILEGISPFVGQMLKAVTITNEVRQSLYDLKQVTEGGLGDSDVQTLQSALKAAKADYDALAISAQDAQLSGLLGATEKQIEDSKNLVKSIEDQIAVRQKQDELKKKTAGVWAEYDKKEKARLEEAAKKAAERTAQLQESAKLEEEMVIKRRDLDILSAQQVEEAQIAAMTRVADMENAWIAQQEENRKKTLADQQELANNLIDSYGFLAESVGMALVDSSKGWDYFKEQGKNAVIGVLKGFAKQWAAQAVAYYATGDFVRGSGMAGASAGAIAASGAVKAFAQGGTYTTAGEEFIKVGDNASGRERVTVQPLGTSDTTGVTQVLVYLSERVVLDAVARASADGRLIINARGVK